MKVLKQEENGNWTSNWTWNGQQFFVPENVLDAIILIAIKPGRMTRPKKVDDSSLDFFGVEPWNVWDRETGKTFIGMAVEGEDVLLSFIDRARKRTPGGGMIYGAF